MTSALLSRESRTKKTRGVQDGPVRKSETEKAWRVLPLLAGVCFIVCCLLPASTELTNRFWHLTAFLWDMKLEASHSIMLLLSWEFWDLLFMTLLWVCYTQSRHLTSCSLSWAQCYLVACHPFFTKNINFLQQKICPQMWSLLCPQGPQSMHVGWYKTEYHEAFLTLLQGSCHPDILFIYILDYLSSFWCGDIMLSSAKLRDYTYVSF